MNNEDKELREERLKDQQLKKYIEASLSDPIILYEFLGIFDCFQPDYIRSKDENYTTSEDENISQPTNNQQEKFIPKSKAEIKKDSEYIETGKRKFKPKPKAKK